MEKFGNPSNQIETTISVGNTDLLIVAAMDKCNIIFTKFFFLTEFDVAARGFFKRQEFCSLGHADVLFCREIDSYY